MDTLKRTFHVVYDTTGSSSGFDLATDLVRNNGGMRLVLSCSNLNEYSRASPEVNLWSRELWSAPHDRDGCG